MKIAVTYDIDTKTVFQHFGHTENIKIYDVEDGKIVNSEVVSTGGAGCGACKLVGPAGEVEVKEGVIAAKRHIHMTPASRHILAASSSPREPTVTITTVRITTAATMTASTIATTMRRAARKRASTTAATASRSSRSRAKTPARPAVSIIGARSTTGPSSTPPTTAASRSSLSAARA